MTGPFVAFHFGLVQDVAVLRPLARLAARDPSLDVRLLVSSKFAELDSDPRWSAEIEELAAEVGASPFLYESPFDCLEHLGPGSGMIIAGSESDAKAHRQAHELFRVVPGRYRTVTLQHGLECVGFLHNARHDATSGRDVRFSADIAVSWFDPKRTYSASAAELTKLFFAGPQSLIDPPNRSTWSGRKRLGLVCENLHSVRFANDRLRQSFLDTFLEFAARLGSIGEEVILRPHPAGRFTDRKQVRLPANVRVSREPLYKVDFGEIAYCISAPSTILFDFAVAGIPAATWNDGDRAVDTASFAGLPEVSSVEDFWRFHWAVQWQGEELVARQDDYVRGLGLPRDVRERYQALLGLA